MQGTCKVSYLSFTKGFKINCGIDLIGISISDGIEGFKAFLSAHDGSFGKYKSQDKWHIAFSFHYRNSNLEGSYNRGAKRLILKVGGLTQYSDTSKSFERWSLLQALTYHYGESLRINEVHFAVDVPYRFADISIYPEEKVYRPQYPSVIYFDSKRKPGMKLNRDDDFVIYDKCRKCRIGRPLTRIELRLKDIDGNLLNDPSSQSKTANRVKKKFKYITIKKNRSIIRVGQCDWKQVLGNAMGYIGNDESLYRQVFGHRNDEIEKSGEVFKAFMTYCRQKHIFSSKPQTSPKAKPFLRELTPQQRQMLNHTIASYNAYDKKWYQDQRFKMKSEAPVRTRLTDELKDEILFMIQQGQTQVSIAEELNVSEATVSRWLSQILRRRKVKLKDSVYQGIIVI